MNLHKARRASQFISLLVLHMMFLPIAWVGAKWLCLPVLSCHACPGVWSACPVGVLIHFSGWRLVPWFALGTIITFGVLVGRLFCGWVCPFGTFQALLYRIPSPKITLPPWTGYLKYVVLVLLVFLFPFVLGEQTYLSFCRICPTAALQVVVPNWIQDGFSWGGWLMTARFTFLALVVLFAIMASRSFCKVICPVGAIFAGFNHFSLKKVDIPESKCVSCGRCDKICTTDVKPSERILKGQPANRHHDCVVCYDCKDSCPVVRQMDKGRFSEATSPD